jgi:hypothetical protein
MASDFWNPGSSQKIIDVVGHEDGHADCCSVLPLALVRNVPVFKRAILRQACFTWRGIDNIAVLVSLALLSLPIDELAAEFAVFAVRVRHWCPIRTVHRYRSFSSIGNAHLRTYPTHQ